MTVDEREFAHLPAFEQGMPQGALARVLARVEAAFESGNDELSAELIERHTLACIFGLPPTRLAEMLDALLRRGTRRDVMLRALQVVAFQPERSLIDEVPPIPDMRQTVGADFDDFVRLESVIKVRLAGRPVEALHAAAETEKRMTVMPHQAMQHGWGAYFALQYGTAQMLAGDFSAALVSFTEARMHFTPPELLFLTRQACVKAALLESLFGDEDRARSLLDEVDRLPRLGSWLEADRGAAYGIAASRVRSSGPDEALRMLTEVPLRSLGELWPFYAHAVQRARIGVQDVAGALHELETLAQLPLPLVEGQGFTGSALPLAIGMTALIRGDLSEARRRFALADQGIAATRLLTAVLDVRAGRPDRALRIAAETMPSTRGLRFLELWRLAAIAHAHYALGEIEPCVEALGAAMAMPGGVRPREARSFSEELRDLARSRFDGWPSEDAMEGAGGALFSNPDDPLTERELELVRALAAGLTREQIAREHYISINTLKSHLRSIYRKLGVNSRSGAVLAATQRGLFSEAA